MTTPTIESIFLAALKTGPVTIIDNMKDRTHAATSDPLVVHSPLVRLAILAVDLGADPERVWFNHSPTRTREAAAAMYNVGADDPVLTSVLQSGLPAIGFHYCSLNSLYFVDEVGLYGQRLKTSRLESDNPNVLQPFVWFEPRAANFNLDNPDHVRLLQRVKQHFVSNGWHTAAERLEKCFEPLAPAADASDPEVQRMEVASNKVASARLEAELGITVDETGKLVPKLSLVDTALFERDLEALARYLMDEHACTDANGKPKVDPEAMLGLEGESGPAAAVRLLKLAASRGAFNGALAATGGVSRSDVQALIIYLMEEHAQTNPDGSSRVDAEARRNHESENWAVAALRLLKLAAKRGAFNELARIRDLLHERTLRLSIAQGGKVELVDVVRGLIADAHVPSVDARDMAELRARAEAAEKRCEEAAATIDDYLHRALRAEAKLEAIDARPAIVVGWAGDTVTVSSLRAMGLVDHFDPITGMLAEMPLSPDRVRPQTPVTISIGEVLCVVVGITLCSKDWVDGPARLTLYNPRPVSLGEVVKLVSVSGRVIGDATSKP